MELNTKIIHFFYLKNDLENVFFDIKKGLCGKININVMCW